MSILGRFPLYAQRLMCSEFKPLLSTLFLRSAQATNEAQSNTLFAIPRNMMPFVIEVAALFHRRPTINRELSDNEN